MKKQLAITAMLVSLALATNYALIGIPQVKLMDGITFLIAYVFGLYYGVIAAISIWLIYGTLNPYGFSLFALLMTITGQMSYVIIAIIARKMINPLGLVKNCKLDLVLISFFALISTLIYDLYTNALTGLLWYNSLLVGIIVGIPFSIIHITANVLLFPLIVFNGVFILNHLGVIYGKV